MKQSGLGINAIGRALRRSGSTISLELKRNTNDKRFGYLPDEAHRSAVARKANHGLKMNQNPTLKASVIMLLKDGWSPEIIAGSQALRSVGVTISTETIYQFIYGNDGQELELYKLLLKARPRRGKLYARKPRSTIRERVSIHDRPAHIATREEFGHLEGDLTFMTSSQSMNIGVVVERKTRFALLFLNQSKHSAVVIKGIFNRLAKLPAAARRSITFDNGVEFARHTLLKRFMSIDMFFCDKHAPWQKGQVEQTNVMLHRYLPKNSNLAEISDEQLASIQTRLNNRPRKCLGFRTPAEAYKEELERLAAPQ